MSSTIDPTPTTTPDASPADASPTDAGGDDDVNCGTGGGDDRFFGLRVASIFVILVTSMFGALFPVIARRTRLKNVIPLSLFE